MDRYDYFEAVKSDVIDEINDEYLNRFSDFDDMEEFAAALNNELWVSDRVTGSGSGSYTFSAWEAEENICHNFDLIEDACEEFGYDMGEAFKNGAEYLDVLIRCYLLGSVISEVLLDFEQEFEEAHRRVEECR